MNIRIYALLLAAVGAIANGAGSHAAEDTPISPYLTDDVGTVAQVNLERIDATAILEELVSLNLAPADQIEEGRRVAAEVQKAYAELPRRGARRLYVLVRSSDVFAGGPTWIIETNSPDEAKSVHEWLKGLLAEVGLPGDLDVILPNVTRASGSVVLGGPSAERLEEIIATSTKAPRAEALAAVESIEDADAGLVLFGGADDRRVIRELFPQMPAPFTEIDGKLLANGLARASIEVKVPPEPTVSLTLEATDEQPADILQQAFDKGHMLLSTILKATALAGSPATHQQRAAALLPMLPHLKVEREGTRLRIKFGDEEQEIAFLRNLVPTLVQPLREEAHRAARINNFKQILLGMLNYESAKGVMPAAASYDKDGRPLLSWRVHILPYVDQMALYNQFKLDEPWNSEHNRKLIDKMPAIYADPGVDTREAGRTTFVVPTGEGLVFGGTEGMKYRELKDGSSNTILIVELPPEKAVTWTQPADWEVNLEDPLSGLARPDRDAFTAGYADGHVSVHSLENEPAMIRALITPNGGETIDYQKLR